MQIYVYTVPQIYQKGKSVLHEIPNRKNRICKKKLTTMFNHTDSNVGLCL